MEAEGFSLNNVERVLKEYCKAFEELVKEKLEDNKATGNLINSVKTRIVQNGLDISVVMDSEDYLKYVEEGRKSGAFPNVGKIKEWIQAKGITPYPTESGRLPTENQLAYLIGRAIAEHGTIKQYGYTGSHAVANTVEELNEEYIGRLQEALEEDWGQAQIKILEDLNKMMAI